MTDSLAFDELESKGVQYTNVMPASADLASGAGSKLAKYAGFDKQGQC